MRTLRALGALLPLALVASTVLVGAVPAAAQEPSVDLTLRAQTPVTTLEQPDVTITFRAENLGEEALGELTVAYVVGPAITSRGEFTTSLAAGPGSLPIGSNTEPQGGTLESGATREFRVTIDLGAFGGVSDSDSAVYPARIDLRSGGVQVGWIDTPLVHLVRQPDVPVELAWWAEFDAPVALDSLGRLADPAFEAAIGPEGGLTQQVGALRAAVAPDDGLVEVDLVVVPSVVDQLSRMADGYERSSGEAVGPDQPPATSAAALLEDLRALLADPDVHLVVTPFAAPLLPSLASGGLGPDLDRQKNYGDRVVSERVGGEESATVARPPQGALDEPSLQWLAERGATALLVQTDTVERPEQTNDFALLPTTTVTTHDGAVLDLVMPDPGVQALLGDPTLLDDPVLTAQAVLGDLATVWREQPVPGLQPDGTETVRGIAVAMPAALPPGIWAPLIRRLAEAPFLRPTPVASFVDEVNPVQPPATVIPSLERFPRTYVDAIRDQRRNVAAYRSMLAGRPSPQPARLERNLLYAEAGQYVGDPDVGRRWYDQVNAATTAVFTAVLPDVQQEFLLTSAEGSIPLRMGDPGPTPLTVQVVLRSASFEFPDGAQQTVTLQGPDEIVTFDVVAKVGGPQTIRAKVRAPSGRDLGEDQNLAVRTTAVNDVALWITIGAGLLLLLLWSRRLFRRRTT
jgi:hypothetical protein